MRLRAEVETPIAGAHDLHLDGLLMAVHRGSGIAPTRSMAEVMRFSDLRHPSRTIAYVEHAGHIVPLCSTMMGDFTRDSTHITQRRDAKDVEALARKVDRGAGPDRDKLLPVPLRVCRDVWWDFFGDRREVMSLLRGVEAIGAMRRHGWGRVRSWSCESIDSFALVEDSLAVRHLPAECCVLPERIDRGACEPPYWHPSRLVARVPAWTRCDLSEELRDAVAAVVAAHSR
jgi:hypothetical protein